MRTLKLETDDIKINLYRLREEERLDESTLCELDSLLTTVVNRYEAVECGEEKLFTDLDKIKVKIVVERMKALCNRLRSNLDWVQYV